MATVSLKSSNSTSSKDKSHNLEKKQPSDSLDQEEQLSVEGGDLFHVRDEILAKKMELINNAINEVGFTKYHWKLFFLNGMGYAVDSLLFLLQSVTQDQINTEFDHKYSALVSGNYVGLFFGALFWGLSADIIGRRIAFHTTLFLTSMFAMATAGGLNYVAVCALSSCCYFGAGGNLVLDSVTFLEFLPANKQWLLTFMALFWGVGSSITCVIAWPLIVNFSCSDANNCPRSENMGWRYVYITCGGFVLLCALARVFVIRMVESPKYDIANGNDENVVRTFEKLAASAGKPNPLDLNELKALGAVEKAGNSKKSFVQLINPNNAFRDFKFHVEGLFATRTLGLSTFLNFLSWTLIGLAYPLYNAFLPQYLNSRNAALGDSSLNTTMRDNLIVNICSIFGPVIAGPLCEVKVLGRRGTMVIGSLLTMVFMFVYTTVRTPAQNLGFSCAINVCLNIYYGTLFAYTPEVLPAAHRGSGNGLSVSLARAAGTIAPVVAYYSNTKSAAPVYIMAALFLGLAIASGLMPYEVRGRHSV